MAREPSPITLVLDSNVFLDIHSCHDLKQDVDRLTIELKDSDKALDHKDVRFRLCRARESALFAIYLNKMGTSTWSLREAVAMLFMKAPPKDGGQDMASDFTTQFVHYVKDYLLPDWNPYVPEDESTRQPSGDAADLALLDYAEVNSLAIVTNEGVYPDELRDTKRGSMRRRGPARGVRVCAPRQFYGEHMDVDVEIDTFLEAFKSRAREYIEARGFRDKIHKVLQWIHGYYQMILRGIVNGREQPLF
jgi:hypothetical protein